jgi:uncharacterized protein (DUF2384 family)
VTVLEDVERQALEEADAAFGHIQESLEEAARSGALDSEAFERLARTARDLAGRINESLPPEIDPRAADEIRRRLIAILTLPAEGESLNTADRFLLEMEAVRHILRDLVQEQPVDLRDGKAVIELLEGWLPRVSVNDLAALLGYSSRQLQRRRRDGGPSTHRAELVARLVAILRHGWTDEGVMAWFLRPRRDLDGARPIDLMDDPGREHDLLRAARAGRVQGGG